MLSVNSVDLCQSTTASWLFEQRTCRCSSRRRRRCPRCPAAAPPGRARPCRSLTTRSRTWTETLHAVRMQHFYVICFVSVHHIAAAVPARTAGSVRCCHAVQGMSGRCKPPHRDELLEAVDSDAELEEVPEQWHRLPCYHPAKNDAAPDVRPTSTNLHRRHSACNLWTLASCRSQASDRESDIQIWPQGTFSPATHGGGKQRVPPKVAAHIDHQAAAAVCLDALILQPEVPHLPYR